MYHYITPRTGQEDRRMHAPMFDRIIAGYDWKLSLATLVAVLAATFALDSLARLVPTIGAASRANAAAFKAKMEKPNYAANQKMNRKWGVFFQLAIFGAIMPFCLTLDPQLWWRVLRDIVVILMFYDFVYYLTHRFLFHDGGLFGGPLMWVHAVHHRQHNPCRWDASYIHPLEVAMGLGLYVGTIALFAAVFGRFHVATIVLTWIAFTEINLHNHNLWQSDRFPFRYLNYLSKMHHNHHARFTGGNYATISLLYDWMFGTLDYGDGANARRPVGAKAAR
jgi:sterol desaturase/sphingolipid hydroxylase (fatty acid hydroxylase superfamily)